MKELTIISGKGGTGKTSIVAAFASLAEKFILCDADVDASDLHLIFNPQIIERHEFKSGNKAVINKEKCTQCGLCLSLCRFEAINKEFKVDSLACEGCGVCVDFCPENAIDFPQNNCGEWFISDTRFGPFVHAQLGIAEENSGKLVTIVRKAAQKLAKEKEFNLILTDGPPGVGCPVIASIGGSSAVLIVTEPTMSGKHDMERVITLSEHFKVPVMICVNKSDLNLSVAQDIEKTAKATNITFLGHIPFDPIFTKAMVCQQNIFEYNDKSEAAIAVKKIWTKILNKLN
ncbi:MAG: ATP-binding protein [Desulfobacterales bacterium]|nr:ATP-binding protein [Desulfobacterales bacterium]